MVLTRGRTARRDKGSVCTKRRKRGSPESAYDRRIFRGWLPGTYLYPVSSHLVEFSSLRQYICRRKSARSNEQASARLWLVSTHPVLLPGISNGIGAGARLHLAH